LKYKKGYEFGKKFDEGKEDISKYLDMSKARRPYQEQKRLNMDFPLWMIHLLDKEAKEIGRTTTIYNQNVSSGAARKGMIKNTDRIDPLFI